MADENELRTMLLSTGMLMTWNGRWVGSRTRPSFSFMPEQIVRPRQEFAQVWYVLEGELCCGGTTYGPGTFVYMPDPHFEDEMTTKSGCTVVFLQYPGPTTGAHPLYDGRMNLQKPESPGEYDLNR